MSITKANPWEQSDYPWDEMVTFFLPRVGTSGSDRKAAARPAFITFLLDDYMSGKAAQADAKSASAV